ncbi:hypothetical protein [Actinoplanes sp. NPDC051851]|uniref:DUF7489 domain-containing protein n=1 Tax=Actinoplanes sp. NPDC051851 TaxID=3154753 RepID=UPI00341B0809
MATHADTWSGTIVQKSRALLDGSNLYRRLTVALDDGSELDVKLDRDLWQQVEVGDRLVKPPGGSPQHA